MSEKRLNNTIFILYQVTEGYCRKHNMTEEEFLEFDNKYNVIDYVSECPDVFDSMTFDEMIEEVEWYVS